MELAFQVGPVEARVLGVLIEKSLATPDSYPMSLNALTLGTNQKQNRDPVMHLSEEDVWRAVKNLSEKHLVENAFGGRVDKYLHKATRMMSLVNAELALLAELLLRGPQTAGELRSRASRMAPLESLDEASRLLEQMITRGYLRRLPPFPGTRAERYVQLLCPDAHPLDAAPAGAAAVPAGTVGSRVEALEQEVENLRRRVASLEARLGAGQAVEGDAIARDGMQGT